MKQFQVKLFWSEDSETQTFFPKLFSRSNFKKPQSGDKLVFQVGGITDYGFRSVDVFFNGTKIGDVKKGGIDAMIEEGQILDTKLYDKNRIMITCLESDELKAGKILHDFVPEEEEKVVSEWQESNSLEIYSEKMMEIHLVIDRAKKLENENPSKAIELYVKATDLIDDYDNFEAKDLNIQLEYCRKYRCKTHRHISYPVNRLSLTLEREKRFQECLDTIFRYESTDDKKGISAADRKSIDKRKIRVLRKLGIT